MKILTTAQVREADRLTTERCGISSLQLMEHAANAVVKHLDMDSPSPNSKNEKRSFLVLCGKGNNGGDGLALARLLHERKAKVAVILAAGVESLSPETTVQWQRWQRCEAPTAVVRDEAEWAPRRSMLSEATDVVDALLGTGIRGPVKGLMKSVIEDVGRLWRETWSKPRIIAVDIPSGLPADAPLTEGVAVRAHCTITFTAPKLGLLLRPNIEYVGRLACESIGTPAALLPEADLHWIEPLEFRDLPLQRPGDAHKGNFGHVLIVAGSRGKTGAGALAGMGALHSGAGLVTVATAQGSLAAVGHAPELMTEPLPETEAGSISLRALDYSRFEKLQEGKSVLAIGPGLGTHPETQELIRTLLSTTKLPVVLDADGLNAFAGRAEELANRRSEFLAITPHPGEMARLWGCATRDVQARRIALAREAAAKWKCTVILKGAGTIIAPGGNRADLNTSGNPWMASGGTGDVLTGMLAGYVAQYGSQLWEKALCFGVYCHGRAGDMELSMPVSGPVLASALLRHLGAARNEIHSYLADHPDETVDP